MFTLSTELAKHFRQVHDGGNWTSVNLKQTLADLTWQQATTKIDSLNTIAVLVFHINYYVGLISKVLQGAPLEGHDKFSFDLPPIQSQEDWEKLLNKFWSEAEALASLIEQIPENKWSEIFVAEKYGTYFRNIVGLIEHTHYHLGQIVLIKKMILQAED
jgi:hypothetical protein